MPPLSTASADATSATPVNVEPVEPIIQLHRKRRSRSKSALATLVVIIVLLGGAVLGLLGYIFFISHYANVAEDAVTQQAKRVSAPVKSPKKAELNKRKKDKTAGEAKAELQDRIERYLGGQNDAKTLGGLFSISAALTNFDRVDIETVGQKYDAEGFAIPNEFVATFRASGSDKRTGQPRAEQFQLFELSFRSEKW